MNADEELAQLRDRIRAVDQALVELTARRLALARRVGEIKADRGVPIRNYVVEAEAIQLVREAAQRLDVRPQLVEELLKLEIRESLRVQERDRVVRTRVHAGTGAALVVGAAGHMGRWFVEFLESKGFDVTTSDVRGPLPDRPHVDDVASAAKDFDLVLLATPPGATADLLHALQGRTQALVIDIASLKSPHAAALRALAASGTPVASIHPMWGPDTELLADKNLLVCGCGDASAVHEARKLFEDTAARIVELPLDEHDRFMALVLGLPHAVSLVFAHALTLQEAPLASLANLGGPTFRKQVAVSREVANENKDLYYEIQRLNPHTPRVLSWVRQSLDELEAALADRDAFRRYMATGQAWIGSTEEDGP